MDFIPVNRPDLNGREREYLLDCVDTGWISSEGPYVQRLEEAFAARVGRAYGVAVSNGSVAPSTIFCNAAPVHRTCSRRSCARA